MTDRNYSDCEITLRRPLDHPEAAGRPLYHDVKGHAEQRGWVMVRGALIERDRDVAASRQADEAYSACVEIIGRVRRRGLGEAVVLDEVEVRRALKALDEACELIAERSGARTQAGPDSYQACEITLRRSLNHPEAVGRRLYHDILERAEQRGWQMTRAQVIEPAGPIGRDSRELDEAVQTLHDLICGQAALGTADADAERAVQVLVGVAEALAEQADEEPRPNARQLTLI